MRCSTPITCSAVVKDAYEVPHGDRCMHEFVASARTLRRERTHQRHGHRQAPARLRLSTPPTVYFPLVVPEALMIEPTETESKETLDAFADALLKIRAEDAGNAARGAAHAGHQPARRGQGGQGADPARWQRS